MSDDVQSAPEMVRLGMYCAWRLGVPLTVAGRKVTISEDEAKALIPADDLSAAAVDAVATKIPPSNYGPRLELARRVGFVMSIAAHYLERTGLKTGDIAALPPVHEPQFSRPADAKMQPEKPPREISVVELEDGSARIDNRFDVRSSDGQNFYVVIAGHEGEQIESWHPSRDAALAWARERAAEGDGRGAQFVRMTWPRRQHDVPMPPTILPTHLQGE